MSVNANPTGYITHDAAITSSSSSSSVEIKPDIKYSQDFIRKNLISKEYVLILFSLWVDVCFQGVLYRVSNERMASRGVLDPLAAHS